MKAVAKSGRTRRLKTEELQNNSDVAPEIGDIGGVAGESRIGEALQGVRTERGLTLQDLARLSGVSSATLWKIENGRSGASFDTIYRIAIALGLSLDQILKQPISERFATGRRSISRAGEGVSFGFSSYDYLVPCGDLVSKRMLPLIMTIKSRQPLPRNKWATHSGEEYIYVLEGEIELHTEFYQSVRLKAGDSAYIDSQMKHAFANVGKGDGKMLSICLTGSFEDLFGTELPQLKTD
jgi:transcriptional regulator with XRE-family HTH domain